MPVRDLLAVELSQAFDNRAAEVLGGHGARLKRSNVLQQVAGVRFCCDV
jgi:hypothetical protein